MSDGGIIVDGCETVPRLFLKKSLERGDRVAMREKDFGLWQSYTWADYRQIAFDIAHGLLALGLQRGDVVSIQSEDCKEWAWADMGIMLAGGVVNGVYPTYQPPQVRHALTDSRCRILFVEDEEQLDKYLAIEDELPRVERVFVFDWKGLRGFEHDKISPLEELMESGRRFGMVHEGVIVRIADDGRPTDRALLVYTSGTTGLPKGAMIPQRYLMFQMKSAPDYFRHGDSDEILTYLPLCHIAERIMSLCLPLAHGTTINFAESPDTIAQNFQELSPTVIFAVPRVWEKFYSRVTTAMSEGTWLGRKAYKLALAAGMRRADKLLAGDQPSMLDEIVFRLADGLVFSNIKKLLGLDRAKAMYTGAAPISDGLLKWYLAMGLAIDEAYGQTETGINTVTRHGVFRQGTVGCPLPDTEIRLSDAGEILVRAKAMFDGYLNLPEKTAATLVDGWVHTGDVGEIDDEGYLRITDRLKDIIVTAGGKNITPSLIENELKFSAYVSDAIVIGDGRKYLGCLIMIDRDNVEHYAQTNAIPFTDYRSLCACEEVVTLVESIVQEVNKRFSSVETIKKFRLLDVLLTAEDEELTPTMKLKRSFVSEKYADLIESMYDSGPSN
jgi:long-chain acyl-CoA synthetase